MINKKDVDRLIRNYGSHIFMRSSGSGEKDSEEQSHREQILRRLGILRRKVRAETRFVLVGEFSSGKTTILNNLLGEEILRTGLAETTAIPTEVIRGRSTRLYFPAENGDYEAATDDEMTEFFNITPEVIDKSPLLKRFLKEQELVRLEAPCKRLAKSISVVDLPGFSSTNSRIMERAAAELNGSDAILLVVNGRQGITQGCVELIGRETSMMTPVMLMLTHMDTIPPSRRSQVMQASEEAAKSAGIPVETTIACTLDECGMDIDVVLLLEQFAEKRRIEPAQALKEFKEIIESNSVRLNKEMDILRVLSECYMKLVDGMRNFTSTLDGYDSLLNSEDGAAWDLLEHITPIMTDVIDTIDSVEYPDVDDIESYIRVEQLKSASRELTSKLDFIVGIQIGIRAAYAHWLHTISKKKHKGDIREHIAEMKEAVDIARSNLTIIEKEQYMQAYALELNPLDEIYKYRIDSLLNG